MLEPCIESVLKHTDFRKAHLILIDDKSLDERVLPLLENLAEKNKDKITLIANDENLGFVGTTNKGMKLSKNDVVLLNSDTEVPKGWLDKLMKCAESDKKIATVTPLSNNASLASVPLFNQENQFPDGYTFEKMAKLVEECSMHLYPEIPSGHGFCLYIKREALDKVGYFDEEAFGKGYGEENDFCFRCLKKGYKHILCDDVYVFHKGAQSFNEKGEHADELARRYPEIIKKVGWWYEREEVGVIGDNLALRIGTSESKVNILILPRKMDKNLQELINKWRAEYNFHVLLDDGDMYKVQAFFKDNDLVTAIYRKPIVCHGTEKKSEEYKRMLAEISEIFKISVVEEGIFAEGSLIRDVERSGKKEKLDFAEIGRAHV